MSDRPEDLAVENAALRRQLTELRVELAQRSAAEEKFRRVFRNGLEAFYLTRFVDGRIVDCSEVLLSTFGYAREEVMGRTPFELNLFVEPTDRQHILDRLAERKSFRDLELPGRRKNGERFPAAVSASTLEIAGVPHILGIVRDITQRKQAEQALRDEQAFVQALFDAAPFLLYVCDTEGRILRWNDEFHKLGYSTEELAGMGMLDWFPRGPDRAAIASAFREVLEKGRTAIEAAAPLKNGGLRPYHFFAVTFQRAGKTYVCGIGVELTEVKRREAELHASNAKLVELDRRKDEFLAMLSHELRTPLAPISNSLYILARVAPGGEQARRALTILERQVRHLTRLVDDLLDVARITRGKIRLERARIDLNEVALQTVEDLRSVFDAAGVELNVLAAPAEVWVDGDTTRLSQAVGNLLQNAAKFTPKGGKTTLSVEADLARSQAVLTVLDTGIGLTAEMLPRLFGVFAQADTSLDRSRGGLGLGLALAKGLIEMHGGSISAASEGEGKGAAFTLFLPLAPAGGEPTVGVSSALQ